MVEAVLPTFLLVGAMKCGTTSLYAALDRLPDVGFTRDKEPSFLADPGLDRDALVAAYTDAYARPSTWRGDASTDYSKAPHVPGVPERAVDLLGEVPIVYLVRDPVARIRSHWRHLVVTGRTTRSLEQVLARSKRLVNTSRYAMQLDRWAAVLPRERILVLHLDEFRNDPDDSLRRVVRHLGMDDLPEPVDELPRENVRASQLRGGTLSDRVAEAGLYRRYLRGLLPRRLRSVVPTALGHRGRDDQPDDTLTPATERALRAELEPELDRLRAEYGLRWGNDMGADR